MRSYGPRFDRAPDGLAEQTMRVATAAEYEIAIDHYRLRVGTGTIRCQTLKAIGQPGRRIVQLIADYTAADGIPTQQVVVCRSIEEETQQLQRLDRIIRTAQRTREAVA